MEDGEILLKKRFSELAARAEHDCFAVYSDFLSLAEQDAALSVAPDVIFYGGYPSAERKIAVFGESYGEMPPVVWIKISPKSEKFADTLVHRDFLGALVGLGIRREMLGDIIVSGNSGYLICRDTVSDFIISELSLVKRTSVVCEVIPSAPDVTVKLPPESEIVIASERLDAVIAAVYKLSRSESRELIEGETVYVNSRSAKKITSEPKEGDVISVRKHGRFIYLGIIRETKKGRLRVKVRIFP